MNGSVGRGLVSILVSLVVIAMLTVLALRLFERSGPLPVGRGGPPARAVLDSVELRISGMQADVDALTVQAALQRVPGVAGAQVDFTSGRARITYDPNRTRPEQLIAAVRQTGFRASR